MLKDFDVGPIWGHYEAKDKIEQWLREHPEIGQDWQWTGHWNSENGTSVAQFKQRDKPLAGVPITDELIPDVPMSEVPNRAISLLQIENEALTKLLEEQSASITRLEAENLKLKLLVQDRSSSSGQTRFKRFSQFMNQLIKRIE